MEEYHINNVRDPVLCKKETLFFHLITHNAFEFFSLLVFIENLPKLVIASKPTENLKDPSLLKSQSIGC